MAHYYVYYLLDPETQDLLYIGRSNNTKQRQSAFFCKNKRVTTLGISQRFQTFSEACEAELLAIEKHRPVYNKNLVSSVGHFGKPLTESTKQKLRTAMLGRSLSAATKKKMSTAKEGQIPHNKGKTLDTEGRAKLSKAHLGRPLSEAHKKSLSLARTGRLLSSATKAKIGRTNKQRATERWLAK
jgi:predicted GIY-YIG superfamily endonuclease